MIDGISFEKAIVPAEWHDASADRNAEVLSYDPASFPAVFSDVFTVITRFGDYFMDAVSSGDAVSYIYLRSYAVDNDNFFAVVYDITDSKIKLVNEVGGTNTVVATISTAINLFSGDSITVGVSRTTTAAILYAWHAGTFQSASGTITNHTIDRSYWGSHPDGTQGGSLVFVRDTMDNTVLTESEIKAEMQWPLLRVNTIRNFPAGWLSR